MTTIFDPSIGKSTRWQKGSSGNPGGRPKSRLLSEALRARLEEVAPDDPGGRTYAELVAHNLVAAACSQGPRMVSAAVEIGDRVEGRATQRLDVNDITADLRSRSDDDLAYHLEHGHWPSRDEAEISTQQT